MSSRQDFTPQQAKAIDTRGVSIALSAGAGCGKTFVLTQRFLAGLHPDPSGHIKPDLHSLVAITFTERAAREMRDRIRAACHEQLKNAPEDGVDYWLEILRGLDSARISTIHSFCTRLLRSQAVEAGLDPRFGVLEPPLADTLLRHVVRDVFHGLIESGDRDAVQFVVQFGLERSQELLRKLTVQRFQIEFAKFADATPEKFARDWLFQWHEDYVPKIVAEFRESPLVASVLRSISGSPSKNATMKERIANLRLLFAAKSPWNDIPGSLEAIQTNARIIGGGGKSDWASEEIQTEVKEQFEVLRRKIGDLTKSLSYRDEDVVEASELACRALRLTECVSNRYAEAKRDQGVLDFDDLLLHARNLLRGNESVRRAASGIQLLMVDEFQDTDPVQAEVVRSLCGAAITKGRLFMVGDRKQSIYRFRRADPTVFASMSAALPEEGRLPLNVNFRSQPAILNFVNHLFASAMPGYEFLRPFENRQWSPTPAIEFLLASFDAEGADAEGPEELVGNVSYTDSSSSDDDFRANASELRAREADWIARRIATLLTDETPRIRTKAKHGSGQPVLRRTEPGDIVILFRALSSVQEYEAALRRYGLDYYLVGGKAFFAQQEVFDLLNLCRYLDDCDDHVGLVGVLRSPFFNLSDDSLQALAFHTDRIPASDRPPSENASGAGISATRATHSLHETLYFDPPRFLPEDQRNRVQFAAKILSDLRSKKDRIPLPDLLNLAVEQTGYDASLLAEFLGSRKLANLRKLIEMARQFDQREFFTLKDFVIRLQTSVLEETDEEFATTLPESGDVIRIMSIHQSKGLEFPVVFVADIDRKGPPRGGDAVLHPVMGPLLKLPQKFGNKPENLALRMHLFAEADADADETIRLFYVACTRAADYLILSAGYDDDKKTHSPWVELLQSRFDLYNGLLKGDALLGSSNAETAGRDEIPDILVHHVPCPFKPEELTPVKRVPIGEIPGRVLVAEPSDFPDSARRFSRDVTDQAMISVSRLKAIDAELNHIPHAATVARSRESTEDVIDSDMATVLGTIMHTVLERLDFRESAMWPEILKKVLSQQADRPSRQVEDQARVMLSRFVESPLIDQLAGARTIYREIDFILPWSIETPTLSPGDSTFHQPAPVIAGIIDLLIETDEGWRVLDFKTGEFPTKSSDEQLLAPYELQLGLYAHAVEQWYGVIPQELSLITFKPHVRRVTLTWSPARWTKLRARIDRAIMSLTAEPLLLER